MIKENLFFPRETIYGCFPPPPGKENNAHLLHHVWSTDTYRRQQAGNIANALPAVPPVGFPLLPDDWKCRLHFLWFQTCPEERAVNLPEPAAGRYRVAVSASRHGTRRRGADKDGEGLKKGEKIDFAFECVAVRRRKATLPTSLPFPTKKKKKENKSPV